MTGEREKENIYNNVHWIHIIPEQVLRERVNLRVREFGMISFHMVTN